MTARDEIASLFFRYARGFDDEDMDTFADCFTEDAVLSSHVGSVAGRAAIRELFAGRRAAMRERGEGCRHVITNIDVLAVAGDEATVTAYSTLLVAKADGGFSIASVGTYEDVVVREDGVWRFRTHQITSDARA